jgi:hypothetical protein
VAMHRIRRFGVVKTANVVAVMYVVVIAIVFVPIAILAIVFGGASGSANAMGGVVALLVFGFVAALFYAVIGWIFTALACAVYNLAARWIGGIELEIEPVAPPPSLPAWTASTPAPPLPPSTPSAG